MILLLVVAAWILVLSLLAGLCAVARAGDLAQLAHAPGPAGRERTESPWEQSEHLEIAARANSRSARQEWVASLHRDGVAA
jgi:hypothetical protein